MDMAQIRDKVLIPTLNAAQLMNENKNKGKTVSPLNSQAAINLLLRTICASAEAHR